MLESSKGKNATPFSAKWKFLKRSPNSTYEDSKETLKVI